MINSQLRDQLKVVVDSGKVKITYPDGYQAWKKKFDYFYSVTKNVNHTLDAIYGPRGGVNNYKGSITANSNFTVPAVIPNKHSSEHKKKSGALKYWKKK